MRPILVLLCVLAPVAAVAQPRQDPLRERYEAAQTFQLAGDLERAERTYIEDVVPRALQRLAALRSAEGRQDDAARLLETALAVHPASLEARLDLAIIRFRARARDEAAAIAGALRGDSAIEARAATLLGRILLLEGRTAEALERLQQALATQADFDTVYLSGVAWLRLGERERARAAFDRLIDAHGSRAGLHILIGRAWRETGFFDQAITEFRRALEREPRLPIAHRHLALTFLLQGGSAAAARAGAALKAGLAIDPNDETSVRLLAALDAGSLPVVSAADLFEDLLTTPPDAEERRPDPERAAQMRAQLAAVLGHSFYNLGVIASRREAFARAADYLRQAAEWQPRLEGLDRARGVAAFHAGRADEAVLHLRRHLGVQPGDQAAAELLSRARAALATLVAEPPAGALPSEPGNEAARPAPAADPGAERAAELLTERGPEEAERAVWEVLQRRPDDAAALRVLGDVRLAQQRHDEAEALLDRAARLDPSAAAVFVSLADLHQRRGRLDDAAAALERAAALGPGAGLSARMAVVRRAIGAATSADEAIVRARGHVERGEAAQAGAAFEEALAADPGSVPALQGLAALAAARGEHVAAADLLQRARGLAPASAGVLRDLVRAAGHAARVEEALDAARALAAVQPDDPEAVFLLGFALLQNQEWPGARETFERLLVQAPHSPLGHLGLGIAHFGRREYAPAIAALERALELDAAQVEAEYHLALIAREEGRSGEAVAHLERVITRRADHGEAHTLLGTLYLLERDYPRARAALERAADLRPGAAEPHYQLALLYARTGDRVLAQEALARYRAARDRLRQEPPP